MYAKIEGIRKMKHAPSNFASTGTKFHTVAWNYPSVFSIVFTHFLFQPCKAEKHRKPEGPIRGEKKKLFLFNYFCITKSNASVEIKV